ncbi:MAG TPA: hypothetical protein VK420_22845 [Longimicrobium sp.]|nr:hypothetical protein [Longimicrobium sp.]
MAQRSDIRPGMVVRSQDGEALGRVFAVDETRFEIEKGVFAPEDYAIDFQDVREIRDGEIILAHGRADLHRADLLSGSDLGDGSGVRKPSTSDTVWVAPTDASHL